MSHLAQKALNMLWVLSLLLSWSARANFSQSDQDTLSSATGALLSDPLNSSLAEKLKTKTAELGLAKDLKITAQDKKMLEFARRTLIVSQLAKGFNKCVGPNTKDLTQNILNASVAALSKEACLGLGATTALGTQSQSHSTREQLFAHNLKILNGVHLYATAEYWSRRLDSSKPVTLETLCKKTKCSPEDLAEMKRHASDSPFVNQSAEPLEPKATADALTKKIRAQISQPSDPEDLLLWTNTLTHKREQIAQAQKMRGRKPTAGILPGDIEAAAQEIVSSAGKEFSKIFNQGPAEARTQIDEWVQTTPASVGQSLLEQPENLDLVCESLARIELQVSKAGNLKSILLWGGAIVGGTALVLTVGAPLVLTGAALSATLVATASITAIASVADATAVGANASKLLGQARSYRSEFFAGSAAPDAPEKIREKETQAYQDFAAASFELASVIPFGSAWSTLAKTAERATSTTVAVGTDVSSAALVGLNKTATTIQADRALTQKLAQVKTELGDAGDTTMAKFVGMTSSLPESEQAAVLKGVKSLDPKEAAKRIEQDVAEGEKRCAL